MNQNSTKFLHFTKPPKKVFTHSLVFGICHPTRQKRWIFFAAFLFFLGDLVLVVSSGGRIGKCMQSQQGLISTLICLLRPPPSPVLEWENTGNNALPIHYVIGDCVWHPLCHVPAGKKWQRNPPSLQPELLAFSITQAEEDLGFGSFKSPFPLFCLRLTKFHFQHLFHSRDMSGPKRKLYFSF